MIKKNRILSGTIGACWAFLSLAAFSSVSESPPTEQCLEPLSQDVKAQTNNPDQLPIQKLVMNFGVEKRVNGAETVWLIIPKIRIISSFQEKLDAAKLDIQRQIKDQIPSEISASGYRFYDPIVNTNGLVLPGSFIAEKRASMTGFCCSGFSCRSCEWSAILWERRIKFETSIGQQINLGAQSKSGDITQISMGPAENSSSIVLKSIARTDDDRNTPDRIWDDLGGFLEAIAKVFNGHDQIQLSDYLGNTFDGKDEASIDSQQIFSDSLERHGYSPVLVNAKVIRPYDAGTGWQTMNSALTINTDLTGFTGNGPVLHVIQYDLNLMNYLKSLSRPPKSTNLLDWRFFCDSTRDSLKNDYLPNLAKKIEGLGEKKATITANSTKDFRNKVMAEYGVGGADEIYRQQVIKFPWKRQELTLELIPKSSIRNLRGVIPAGGSLWTTAREQSWSQSERSCSYRLARSRSGNLNKVFPFQDFRVCMESATNGYALDAWSRVESKLGMQAFQSVTRLAGPISGNINYRGWYYCSRNPSICAGDNRVMWSTTPSKFGSRGDAHKGLDIISLGTAEVINLVAAADGQLIYHGTNPQGWGHALLLPFMYNSVRYIAVYAHLPPSAKNYDGIKVSVGGGIGLAGCSGNAGDGSGKCNNSCNVGSFRASDIHLHFELLKDDGGVKVAVNPQSIINFTIGNDGKQQLYNCL